MKARFQAFCSVLTVLCAAAAAGCSSSQSLTCLFTESELRSSSPDFSYDTFSYPSDGRPRVEVFLQVGYFVLSFEKQASSEQPPGYSARFTASVLFRVGEELVKSETWTENVRVPSFEETRARTYNVSRRVYLLEPGSYRLSVEVLDESSGRRIQKGKTITVPNFANKGIAVSSLVIGTRRVQEGQYVLPTVSGEIVDGSDSVHSQCEVNTAQPGEQLLVTYRLASYRYRTRIGTKPDFLAGFPMRSDPQDSSSITVDTVVTVPDRRLVLQQSFGGLREAHYRLSVTVRPDRTTSGAEALESQAYGPLAQIAVAMKAFVVRPLGFPEVISIEDRTAPLIYIATESEFRSLTEGATTEERWKKLEDFWSTHVDRDLYYERVAYANRYFTCKTDGWRTFPGYVYIVVGPPDAVECLPGVERWFYTSPALQISFQMRQEIERDRECWFTHGTVDPYLLERYVSLWRK